MKQKLCNFFQISLISVSILLSDMAEGQTQKREYERKHYPAEVQDDPYMPSPVQRTSQGYRTVKKTGSVATSSTITTVQVNVNPNQQNVVGDAANEPSISVNPVNPNEIVIGWRQFNTVLSNFRQAGWAYTTNAGTTWNFTGVIDPGVFRSDPILDHNMNGEVFYNSLTSITGPVFLCKVFKSTNGGANWNAGTNAQGGDKQWMIIDRTGGAGQGNIYSFWSSFYSSCAPFSFTRSFDNNLSYEPCSEIDGEPALGNMAISHTGDLFICGAGNSSPVIVAKCEYAQLASPTPQWNPAVTVDLDGYLNVQVPVNPAGLLGQANIDTDVSSGAGQGNVYVAASVTRQSIFDPGDVMFSRSTDGGTTWDLPVRINTDTSTTNTQWLATMSVAPNGRIDIVWLDTRDETIPGSNFSSLYYSYSMDQGLTWSPNESLSPPFDPHIGYPNQDKMGDYFDMVSDNTGAHLAWANTLNGEQDVYYSYIVPATSGLSTIAAMNNPVVMPNPSSGTCFISGLNQRFKLEIYTLQGKKAVEKADCTPESSISLPDQPGVYFLKLIFSDGSSLSRKIVRL